MEFLIMFWLFWIVITAVVASAKGRSAWGWGLLAVPFGLLALIIVACTSNLKAQADRDRKHAELLEATRRPRSS